MVRIIGDLLVGSYVGMVLDDIGGQQSTRAEHGAAMENVSYYRESAVQEGVAGLDREQVRRQQLREALGQQVVGVAKSGVSFTGSVILALNESILRGEQDMHALKRQGQQQVDDFMRAARGELTAAKVIRRSGSLKRATTAANSYGNIQRSQQPTNRSNNTSTNDRIGPSNTETSSSANDVGGYSGTEDVAALADSG
jgi:hypothetical protein